MYSNAMHVTYLVLQYECIEAAEIRLLCCAIFPPIVGHGFTLHCRPWQYVSYSAAQTRIVFAFKNCTHSYLFPSDDSARSRGPHYSVCFSDGFQVKLHDIANHRASRETAEWKLSKTFAFLVSCVFNETDALTSSGNGRGNNMGNICRCRHRSRHRRTDKYTNHM